MDRLVIAFIEITLPLYLLSSLSPLYLRINRSHRQLSGVSAYIVSYQRLSKVLLITSNTPDCGGGFPGGGGGGPL